MGIYKYINDQKQGIYIFIIAQLCSSQCVIPHSAHSHYIYKCTIAGQLQVNNIRMRTIKYINGLSYIFWEWTKIICCKQNIGSLTGFLKMVYINNIF